MTNTTSRSIPYSAGHNKPRLIAVFPSLATMNDLTTSTTARTIPIDDILDEFDDRLRPPSGTQSTPAQDLQDLTKQWIAERGAPEILPYQGALLDRVMERVREQVRLFLSCFSLT